MKTRHHIFLRSLMVAAILICTQVYSALGQAAANLTGSFPVSESWSVTLQIGNGSSVSSTTYSGTETGTLAITNGTYTEINHTGASLAGLNTTQTIYGDSGAYEIDGSIPFSAEASGPGGFYAIIQLSFFVIKVPLGSQASFSSPDPYLSSAFVATGTSLSSLSGAGTYFDVGAASGPVTTNGYINEVDASSTASLTLPPPPPTIQFTASPSSGTPPLTVQFNSPGVDSSSNAIVGWNWNFGDGGASTAQNPAHTYPMAGTFTPTLIATNNQGVAVIGSGPQITVTNPVVAFTADPTNGTAPLTVQFHSPNVDSLGNVITSWNWNFGDGGASTNQNPSHTYTTVGAFIPSIVATNNQGNTVVGFGPQIVVTPSPPIVTIQLTNDIIVAEAGSNVTLTASVQGVGPFNYLWQLNRTNLPPGGVITTVVGGGIGDGDRAINAPYVAAAAVAMDAAGNLFIADFTDNRIRKVGANGIITTVAGNGIQGYSGDGGAATNASLSLSYSPGVAVDAAGNLFIADDGNNVIRKVSTNGIITTVAGNGIAGYSGDGGAATNASLDLPSGVAVDAAGNLFIADEKNAVVRKVSASGIITTVAGNGISGYSGDGGSATNAKLYGPYGVAVDASGNLFIADGVVRKVDTNGIITTVAGNDSGVYSGDGGAATNAGLDSLSGVAVDAAGNLFLADSGDGQTGSRIRKVDTNGIITTVAGNGIAGYSGDGGAATNASLWYPTGVAVDAAGNLFIADFNNHVVRKVDTNGIITTFAGGGIGDGGPATSAVLDAPSGVAVDAAGNLFITDEGYNRVRKVDANGIITTVAGNGIAGYSGDGGAATNARLGPSGVAVDAAGNLFIADTVNSRIRKVDTNGIITTVAGGGLGGGADGLGDGGPATTASLSWPECVAVDAAGNLFIADTLNNRVRKVDTNGIITTVAGGGPGGGADGLGDGGPAANANLYNPSGLAVDAAGNLFIADEYNDRIREVDTNGIITTVAGNGSYDYSGDGGAATNATLWGPSDVAVGAAGNLFIADQNNNVIREVNANGIITTVAGNGIAGYSGDGGAATNARLYDPSGVAVDAAGNLFIADQNNNRIRKVTPLSGPTLVLRDVGATNSGTYDVVVSSPYGSVTSSVVNVTVTLPQVILSTPRMANNRADFTFQLSGPAGKNYVLEASTNLVDWSSISTSSIPISGSITVSNAISVYNRRFYRVYMQ